MGVLLIASRVERSVIIWGEGSVSFMALAAMNFLDGKKRVDDNRAKVGLKRRARRRPRRHERLNSFSFGSALISEDDMFDDLGWLYSSKKREPSGNYRGKEGDAVGSLVALRRVHDFAGIVIDVAQTSLCSPLTEKVTRPYGVDQSTWFDDFKASVERCIEIDKYVTLFLQQRKLEIPIMWLRSGLVAVASGSKLDEKQAQKDVERDAVCINGCCFRGSNHGYLGVIDGIKDAVSSCLGALYDEAPHDRVEEFAKVLLSVSNRTNSGGDTYDVVDRLVKHPDFSIIVPDSSSANPIEIEISCGKVPGSSSWGILASVCAPTCYSVRNSLDAETVLFRLRAEFRRDIAFALYPSTRVIEFDEGGHITLHFEP